MSCPEFLPLLPLPLPLLLPLMTLVTIHCNPDCINQLFLNDCFVERSFICFDESNILSHGNLVWADPGRGKQVTNSF